MFTIIIRVENIGSVALSIVAPSPMFASVRFWSESHSSYRVCLLFWNLNGTADLKLTERAKMCSWPLLCDKLMSKDDFHTNTIMFACSHLRNVPVVWCINTSTSNLPRYMNVWLTQWCDKNGSEQNESLLFMDSRMTQTLYSLLIYSLTQLCNIADMRSQNWTLQRMLEQDSVKLSNSVSFVNVS